MAKPVIADPIVTDIPIIGFYDRQRFRQFNPSDCCNWYMSPNELGKKKVAMYPTMGRRHINFLGQNALIFNNEPRYIEKTVNYWYSVVGDQIFRIDQFFNQVEITASVKLNTLSGNIFLSYIVASPSTAGSVTGITLVLFTDGINAYLYREETGEFGIITDTNLPKNPMFSATFGNRITVSTLNGATFGLSEINLNYNATFATMLSTAFTIASAAVFAQEEGIIRQMAVLQNTLYIFTDYTTGVWSNIPSIFISAGGVQTAFPWKKNTTYSFDFGMSAFAANTLDVDFGIMTWLGQNKGGLIVPLVSTGGKPKPFSSKAIDVLLQREVNATIGNPFLLGMADGFLYDYENTIFYRLSAGTYSGTELLDQVNIAYSIEYNFETETWHRCIEANGERNRIQEHIYFADRHLVTVQDDNTVYEMSGRFYNNEITNPDADNNQATDAYLQLPFRYERVTPILVAGMIQGLKAPGFYAEFQTNYVEIDFIWGFDDFINSDGPFDNAQFIIDEQPDIDGNPQYLVSESDPNQFIIAEQGNYPELTALTYFNWFKPSIELLFSDDGGISFHTAGNLEFSELGRYQWRMRWYQLGCSRNRVYKLVCVSPAPIVVLGASMEVQNVSGGAA